MTICAVKIAASVNDFKAGPRGRALKKYSCNLKELM